jgi:hypothetical protein
MSKLYDVYRKQVFDLAATLVIKHSEVADRMNVALIERGIGVLLEPGTTTHHLSEGFSSYDNGRTFITSTNPANPYDPMGTVVVDANAYANGNALSNAVWEYATPQKTWRYYMNIAGMYHVEDKRALRAVQRQWLEDNYGQYTDVMAYREVLNDGSTRQVFDLDILAGRIWVLAPRAIEVWNSGLNQWDEATTITLPTAFDADFVSDRITAWEYRYGTVLYTDLIARYPDYVLLINGVLNPVNIDVAVRAPDGSVLAAGDYTRKENLTKKTTWFERVSYGSTTLFNNLVEDNEISIIDEIEEWVKSFLTRYHLRDYGLVDDLYLPSMLGVLYLQLPTVIMNIRLANCKTQKAHSYHISEYLESHGRLAKYVPMFSKKQALYLYRNVLYLEAHTGKQSTFKDLIENIMTAGGFSLVGYDARHDNNDLKTTVVDLDDAATGTMPGIIMRRYPMNKHQSTSSAGALPLRLVLEKEIPLGMNNGFDLDETEARMTRLIAGGNYSELKTKVLESVAVDMSERLPFTLSNVRMNYWVYAATMGLYKAKVYFTMPNTGRRASLLAREALILFLYVHNKGNVDTELTDVPTIGARLIPRARLYQLTNPLGYPRPVGLPRAPVNATLFEDLIDFNYMPPLLLNKIIDTVIPEVYLNTTEQFDAMVRAIHTQLIKRYNLYAGQEHRQTRAYAEYAAMSMYWDEVECQILDTPTTYVDWFEQNGIDFTGMTAADYRKLALELLSNATGAGDNGSTFSLRELQEAAIAVMRQFTSYTVQYIQLTLDDSLYLAGPLTLRLGDVDGAVSDTQRVWLPQCNVIDQTGFYHSTDDSHLATAQRIAAAWDLYSAYKQNFLLANPAMSQVKKDKLLIDAFYEYFTEESIYGHDIGSDLNARMLSSLDIDVGITASMRSMFSTGMKINIGGARVFDFSFGDGDAIELLLPQFVLDGFLNPP